MIFPGFIGGSYESQSIDVAAQRCVNLYPEIVEADNEKNVVALYGTPGLSLFATLSDYPIRALFLETKTKRLFAVAGATLYEIDSAGTVTDRGSVGSDTDRATISSNGFELLITSGGVGTIYSLGTNLLTPITDLDGIAVGSFSDGYFIGQRPDTQVFQVSGLYDGTTWNALDFAEAEAVPDNLVSHLVDHRELVLFGSDSIQYYFNSGNYDFPYDIVPGGFIELGLTARWSPAKLINSIYWLGGDSRGRGVVWKMQGYAPVRVSTHAIEKAIQGYGTIEDAVGYAEQQTGHLNYVLTFPTAQATWVFDSSTNLWHERAWWDVTAGQYQAHRAICHTFAYGKHLVGDRENGKIYEQGTGFYDDAGDAIRRLRRTPHVSSENRRVFYHALEIGMEKGVGLVSGQGSDPQVMARWSDDGGHTWGNEYWRSAGKIGEYSRRVRWEAMGSGRDRVFDIAISDPVKVAINHAYLDITLGRN